MFRLFLFVLIFTYNYELIAATKKPIIKEESRNASIVIDTKNGDILHGDNIHKKRHPASLVKVMTLYITFEKLKSGALRINDVLRVSKHAASQPRMSLGLKPNDKITVKDAVMALIITSANDAAVVLAENLAGSEENFAKLMNKKAVSLGMKHTIFKNASGLWQKDQKSTAYDMAVLAIAIKNHFSKYYHLFSSTSYNFKGRTLTSHNNIIKNYQWSDGLKTGYISASGFNIITSAKKNGHYLVGVVFGGDTAVARDNLMISMLNKYFTYLDGKTKFAYKNQNTASKNKLSKVKRKNINKVA
jgi:D-alanyl-D-alanine carboxypeptidase